MPYTIENPPDRIKGLPKHAMEIWIAAYNSAIKQYNGDEAKANGTAWAAVKKKYKKNKEGKWVEMNEPRLIFDLAIEFAEMPDGKYKGNIPIARTGKWKHPEYGEFAITNKDLSEIESNFGTIRESLPPINYEHGEGVDASVGAAGWVQKVWREDGKLLGEVYWTKEGWNKIQTGAFKYISPEIRFHYKDKENGKDQGTVLIGAALTTKPWIEDLAIVLSENVFLEEKLSFQEIQGIAQALNLQEFDRKAVIVALENFLKGQFNIDLPDFARKVEILRTLLHAISGNTYLSETQVREAISIIKEFQGKEWTTAYVNNLPDSSFAYIESGGKKDEEGKTKPRSLRHFPYKDKDGKIDLPHLRNALARAPQSPFGEKAIPKLRAAAKAAGIGEYAKGGEKEMDIKTLIEKFKLNENATEEEVISAIDELLKKAAIDLGDLRKELALADEAGIDAILAKIVEMKGNLKEGRKQDDEVSAKIATLSETVGSLTTQLAEVTKKAEQGELKLREKERDERIRKAMQEGKLTKIMVDKWGREMALNDPAGFDKIVASMPIIIDFTERGAMTISESDAIARFDEEMRRLRDDRKLPYREALLVLARENPELWREYRENSR